MSSRETLLEAIAVGDLDAVASALEVEHSSRTLEEAWKEAGRRGDVGLLELIWQRSQPRKRRYEAAALRAASSQGHEEAIQYLLNQGVSPEARVPEGAPATSFVQAETKAVATAPNSSGTSVLIWLALLGLLAALAVFAFGGGR